MDDMSKHRCGFENGDYDDAFHETIIIPRINSIKSLNFRFCTRYRW